jgi:hypothetical protein
MGVLLSSADFLRILIHVVGWMTVFLVDKRLMSFAPG